MSGTAISQLVPIIAAPILSRLFLPEVFGLTTVYLSIVTILGTLATGRYEYAIILPDKEDLAYNLANVAVLIAIIVCSLSFIVILLFKEAILIMIEAQTLSIWLYFAPLSILLISTYQVVYQLYVRKERFKEISVNRVAESLVNSGTKVVGGFFWGTQIFAGIGAMTLGQIASQVIATGILLNRLKGSVKAYFSWEVMKEVANKYIEFPKYTIVAVIFNILARELPYILFNSFFGATFVGLLSMGQRIIRLPLGVLSSSFGDVFRQQAAKDYVENGECRGIFMTTLKQLVISGLVIIVPIAAIAPLLFSFIFGEKWYMAGVYVQYMAVMFFFQYVSAPLSYMFYVANKQKHELIWQFVLFVMTIGSIYIGKYVYNDEFVSLVLYASSYTLLSCVNIVLNYMYCTNTSVAYE